MKKINEIFGNEFLTKILLSIVLLTLLVGASFITFYGVNSENMFDFLNIVCYIGYCATLFVYSVLFKMMWKKENE